MASRKERLIEKLELKPHPEGGFYKETYRSSMMLPVHQQNEAFHGPRPASTGIYYLLGAGDFSAFHRIQSDEMWHYYEGDAITIHMIHNDGLYQAVELGSDVEKGEAFQLVVPAGVWFAAELSPKANEDSDSYCLAGCTVSPGFDFEEFEMADGYMLKNAFPEHRETIERLVR